MKSREKEGGGEKNGDDNAVTVRVIMRQSSRATGGDGNANNAHDNC